MKKIVLIILGLFLLTQSNINAQTALDSLKSELTEYINKQMKAKKVVGLSIAIVDDQQVVWSDGFGYADKENQIKATANTIYRVGSISKIFTSTSVMQLAEKGLIDIDQPIDKYISDFKIKSRFSKPITTRSILTHHSGIPSDVFVDFFCDKQVPYQTIVNDLNNEYTCAEPGFVHSYSNAGFSLLGYLVEQVSNEDFVKYTENNLFKPLQMNNSSFVLKPNMEANYAKAYNVDNLMSEPYLRDIPAGMLHSNVIDFSNFLKMFFNNGRFNNIQILKPETINEMLTQQNVSNVLDGSKQAGLCWSLIDNGTSGSYAGTIAHHGGDTYAYHAQLTTIPSQKLGVIVMTNSSKGVSVRSKVATRAIELSLKYLKRINAPDVPIGNENIIIEKNYSIDSLKKYAGDYIFGTEPVHLEVKKNRLSGKIKGYKVNFLPNNKGRFTFQICFLGGIIKIKDNSQQFYFKEINNETCIFATLDNVETMFCGKKFTKPVISAVWKERIGKYEITNSQPSKYGFNNFQLEEKEGVLLLKFTAMGNNESIITLFPISDSESVVGGIGRNTGGTISFTNDILYFSGLQMRLKQDTSNDKH